MSSPLSFPALLNHADNHFYPLGAVSPFIVGRSSSANIALTDLHCSRSQFQITFENGHYRLESLSSRCKTFYNEQPINENEPVLLTDNAKIRCGQSQFTFYLQQEQGVLLPPSAEYLNTLVGSSDVPVPPPLPPSAEYSDRLMNSPVSDDRDVTFVGQTPIDEEKLSVEPITLNKPSFVFGREKGNVDILLEHNLVSRKHACLNNEQGQWYLIDLGSANGTFVNGKRLQKVILLQRNDQIDIGPYVFKFSGSQLLPRTVQNNTDLSCQNIIYSVKNRSTGQPLHLLNGISLAIRPRDFVCLIGPSGSGKSTLLNVLSGRHQPSSGIVKMSGRNLHQNFAVLKQRIAVVPQRDILYEPLSSQVGLTYTAQLRLPPDTSASEITAAVDKTIRQVGLTERAETPVAYLSGGQRKRACLGNEILSQPDVLFLDEVTSGLDEQSDREIMSLVKRIASEGKTAIMVTHNLANVEEFCTKTVVLTKGGFPAFYGSPKEAKEYFGVASLGAIYPQLEKQTPDAWKKQFENSPLYRRYITNPLAVKADSIIEQEVPAVDKAEQRKLLFRQFSILLNRRFKIQCCDWMSLVAVAGQCLLVALLIAMLFGNIKDIENPLEQADASAKVLFLAVISCLWFGCNNTAKEIIKERNIYSRERAANLSPIAYFCSKFAFFSVIAAVQAFLLFSIVTSRTAVDVSSKSGLFLMVGLAIIGTVIGLCISVFSKSEDFALAMVPIIIIPQIILAGFIHKVEGLLYLISSCFISAYWGYGGAAALLPEASREFIKMDDWNYALAVFALLVQLFTLCAVTLFRLNTEKQSGTA